MGTALRIDELTGDSDANFLDGGVILLLKVDLGILAAELLVDVLFGMDFVLVHDEKGERKGEGGWVGGGKGGLKKAQRKKGNEGVRSFLYGIISDGNESSLGSASDALSGHGKTYRCNPLLGQYVVEGKPARRRQHKSRRPLCTENGRLTKFTS